MIETESGELSEREREILKLVATGASNKEIAQQLVISPNTVKVHLRNIFAKIGVASRTEATVYAIRAGWVQVPATPSVVDGAGEPGAKSYIPEGPLQPLASLLERRPWRLMGVLALFVAGIATLIALSSFNSPRAALTLMPTPSLIPQWRTLPEMPTARSGLAVAVYDNQIYAIAGQALNGPTGVVERYDPETETWDTLASKPLAVADVQAVVVGGRLYVPGGRLADGTVTDRLEVYDPRRDQWEQRQPLPIAVSAYALATFEGKLYLFGGWDGRQFVASTYEYDPDRNIWFERTPMSTPRGYAGAVVAGGKVYVIGGADSQGTLAINEAYTPDQDRSGENPWQLKEALSEGRFKIGAASVAETIYVVGTSSNSVLSISLYSPQQDNWQLLEAEMLPPKSQFSMVALGTELHFLGSSLSFGSEPQHLSYMAMVTISVPIIMK